MTTPVLLIDKNDDATVVLTLNRPDRRNALTIELMREIVNQFELQEQDSRRRVVVLRAGSVFCAGLDLIEAADVAVADESAYWVARLFESVAQSPLVTIAAVHGAAYAGGLGLMSACDFAVGAEDLRICLPEVRRGLIPALVSTVLRDRLRDADLRELCLLAEPIDAQRARELGLVQRVVPAKDVWREALQLAETVLRGAPNAVRITKQLLREIRSVRKPDAVQRALQLHTHARHSAEAREGLAAFQDKRPPCWE